MRIRSPKDFWSGLVFIAIAVAFMALAARYRLGTAEKMGPGFFPIMIGVVQAGLGAILLGRSFVLDGPPLERMRLPPLAITVVAVVLFGIALSWLGLAAAIAALVIVGAYADRSSRLVESIALAAALIFFSVAMFVWVLGLPLQVWPDWWT
ncbi:MAG TPA: tripartite tricarboxylate transporter TctB family protein [Xanthobacteraceae bacterium]|jgi:putative tricarboxylic transport membrane protein|nr:tripartite tricarboxylate transporter TctB family protein [Xanthobacteraceae bacterium]